MRKLTRQMMKQLEKRFKTTIPWAGALHDDHTDIRHVHILAALPRRLKKHELEALIREVTTLCQEQRRQLEPEKERAQWQETARQLRTAYQPLKFQKRLHLSSARVAQLPPNMHHKGVRSAKVHLSCTCPRCHFPQSHIGRGAHTCVSCGWTLHKKRERTMQRKGRAWDRSL